MPQVVTVMCDGDGTPVEIDWAVGREGGKAVGVTDVLETWLVNDEWWRPPGINRRYLDVILEGGMHVILFEDLDAGHWFAQRP